MKLFFFLILLALAWKIQADVGVNDDYALNEPISFSCPLVVIAPNTTDDAVTDDDYYGALLPPDYPAFTFFYCWMTVFTVVPLLYFAYNNRWSPVGEVKSFLPELIHDAEKKKSVDNSNCHQTGLHTSFAGQLLHYCVIFTLFGIQILLLLLTMCYYFILNHAVIRRDTPELSMAWNPFEDAPQSLYAFIIVWAACFAWVGFFKRPQSLSAAFMRRCPLENATSVAVFIPDSRGIELLVKDGMEWNVTRIFTLFHHSFDGTLAWLFSEPSHSEPGQTTYCMVHVDSNNVRYIDFRMRRYNFDSTSGSFQPAEVMMTGSARDLVQKYTGGMSTSMVKDRLACIGPNVVSMDQVSLWMTIVKEFSRIFYVYQNFMAWTWFNYSYWHMGIVNTLVYIAGGMTVAFVNYKNSCRLRELCKVEGQVEVLRDGSYIKIDQQDVVPGDVITIQAGVAYCDMLVLTGEAVVDESSLTGESMPVAKVPIDVVHSPAIDANLHAHKHNVIYAGTIVINQDRLASDKTASNSNDRANTALVMKTGSYTMKGEMLREMFYGKPKKFKFDMEVSVVMLILLCYAVFAFSMTIYFLNSQPIYGFFFAIYVVASALPPLLPTVFIVSEGISADRLLKKRVAVTDPHRILMAGKVRVAFFDKTGTLTEQGLDFHSVVTTTSVKNPSEVAVQFDEPSQDPAGTLARGMGVCHNLKKIIQDGEVTFLGNAIDRKMFTATSFSLESGYGNTHDVFTDGASQQKYAVIKQFDFDTKRKTQSVIVRVEAHPSWFFIYTKGTGEALKTICLPNSIPSNFDDAVTASAKSGVYQISMGVRCVHIPSLKGANDSSSADWLAKEQVFVNPITMDSLEQLLTMSRNDVESSLVFAGFINFTNPMKAKTPDVIQELKEGDIRTVMISGDHVLTALYIARLSGMVHADSTIYLGKAFHPETGKIDWVDEQTGQSVTLPANFVEALDNNKNPGNNIELALIGHVWDELWMHDKIQATEIAHFVRVIGRCSPHTKISIVDCFNREGFLTMMCGDGGNDCGALKTAHVGIALSDAEASVVSSFTSLDKDIGSVIDVLKEGRCTLSSAFSSYKYMIMYGQIETINQMVCAWFAVTFSEWCWVFMDGFWVITMAFSLPYAEVAKKLAPNRPTSSILGPHTLTSTLGVLLINFLFVVMALGILFLQPWYQCRKWGDNQSIADVTAIGDNYESSVVFLISGYQYITSAIAFNFGFQHRAHWYSNWRFLFFVVVWTVIHFTVVLYPSTLSCFFRVNCENDDVLRGATSADLVPLQNPWHHTMMPIRFRHILLVIMIMNGVALVLWENIVVNGIVATWVKSCFTKENRLLGGVGCLGSPASESNAREPSVVNVTNNKAATVIPSSRASASATSTARASAVPARGGELQLVRSATLGNSQNRFNIDDEQNDSNAVAAVDEV